VTNAPRFIFHSAFSLFYVGHKVGRASPSAPGRQGVFL
jgi:hypothetical protein